jgi:serine/threonine-protein kinase
VNTSKLPLAPGDVIGQAWCVERIVGTGGMAIVAQVSHRRLRRRAAVKMLAPDLAGVREAVERFAREERALGKLHSEHTVRIYDAGVHEGLPFLVLELLEGSDLGELLKTRGDFSVEEAVHFVLQACHAVAEAHSLDIVHRDLKPPNLFLTRRADGTQCIKVLDFGISKVTEEELSSVKTPLTGEHDLMGSPLYMAPEQLLTPRSVDARSDIFALGVTLYQLLSQNLPFAAPTTQEVCERVLKGEPTRLRSLRPAIPPPLEAAILRALRRAPSERFANVADFAQELAPFGPEASYHLVARIAELVPPTSAREVPPATSVLDEPTVSDARTVYMPARTRLGLWLALVAIAFVAGAALGWAARALG